MKRRVQNITEAVMNMLNSQSSLDVVLENSVLDFEKLRKVIPEQKNLITINNNGNPYPFVYKTDVIFERNITYPDPQISYLFWLF